jgi:tetratricopeptide (TPR) repeat protein
MALELPEYTIGALLASVPQRAAVYEADHAQDGATLVVHFAVLGLREGLMKHLPEPSVRRLPKGQHELPWGLVVTGPARMALLVHGLWQWGRSAPPRRSPRLPHEIAAALVINVIGGERSLRVGDKRLEPNEVKGWGYSGIALGARLVGAEGEPEDVAIKAFLGQDSQAAFEKEVTNLRTLTAKISPAALVVRLVGVVEQRGEGGALPWPALVMTPLCVESLEHRIDRFAQEPYTLQEAVAWAGHVALSLHRLHRESRLRHGDVTLRNVLLGRDGWAYLADMGVAEHNHPYGRQPEQEGKGKCYSSSVAPEMVEGGQGASSDARADVWSWGVVLHALLTRSTAMAKEGSVSAYLTIMEDERWWEEVAALWGAEEMPAGVFKAVRHSLCEKGERVGILAGAVLLGQQGLVEAMVGGMEAPEEVKKAELDIARLESSRFALPQGALSPAKVSTQADLLLALAGGHEATGDEAQAIRCLQHAALVCHTDDVQRGKILNDLALALLRRGDHEEAVALLEEALAMKRRLVPEDHPNIATSLTNLASCHFSKGKYDKAVSQYEEALAMQRRLLPGDHLDTATSLNNLASCHHDLGEYGKAVALLEEALAMQRRLLPEDHPSIASSLNNLASCHKSQGEYGEAVLLQEEALAMQRRLLPEDHPDIATSLTNLASCHFSRGEYSKAVRLHEEALAMMRRLLPEDHRDIATSLINLANCHTRQGECVKAVPLYEQTLAMLRLLLPEDHPDIATSLDNLASCHVSQAEYGKAVPLQEEALAMRRRLLPEDHPSIAASLNNLATSHWSQGKYGKAVLLQEEALAMMRRLLPEDHPHIASALSNLATCHESQGEYGKAVLLYEEALAMRRRLLPEDHPDIGWSTAGIGMSLVAMGGYTGAVPHLEEAIAILSKSLPPNHPELLELVETLGYSRTILACAADLSPEADVDALDWSSQSVDELEAFLRSRGVVLEGASDKAALVEAATALAAEEEQQEGC